MTFTRAALIAVVFSALPAFLAAPPAAAAQELKLGVVDIQRVLAASKEGVQAQKDYEAEVKKAQAGVDKKKGEFENLKKSFDKQRDSLNEQARAQKEEELIGMEKEVARSFQDAKEQLRRKNITIVSDLVKEIRKVVEDVGREGDFTLILDRNTQGVLFTSSAVDVTDKVLEKYNKTKK